MTFSSKKKRKSVSFNENANTVSLLDAEDSSGSDPDEDQGQEGFKINEQYAKRFEHNKKREEFQRLQEKHPELARRLASGEGSDSEEESTSEDESGDDLIHPKESEDILRTLVKIKNKDPSIYKADTQFYSEVPSSDEEEEGGEDAKKKRRAKSSKSNKNTLRNIMAKRALEEGAEALARSSDEEDEEPVMTYNEEQEQARKAFTDAANASDDDGDADLDGLKQIGGDDGDFEEGEEAQGAGGSKKVTQELLDEYFGKEDGMNERDKSFLKDYIVNEGWTYKDGQEIEYGQEDEEEEQHWEDAEAYETNYNFRYEEPNSARIETFPRVIESSVRKKESKRKRQRESKQERIALRKQEEALEVKRLKNLKKAEINERMQKIKEVSGLKDIDMDAFDLEGDYDPNKFDEQLSKLFTDVYYKQGDEGLDLDQTGDDNLDAYLKEDGEVIDSASKGLLSKGEGEGGVDLNKTVEDVRGAINEYFKIDYEDRIGDIKCRFKYRDVKQNKYGMDTVSVLGSTDKELNQLMYVLGYLL